MNCCNADQTTDAGINAQRERVAVLKQKLAGIKDNNARLLEGVADALVQEECLDHGR